MKVIIIGGVAGGASAAARLRRLDEQAEIILVERGESISYANCGLPYHLGNVIPDRNDLLVMTPEKFNARFRVDVRTRCEAVSIDRVNKKIILRDLVSGSEVSETYDKLILSTGSSPAPVSIPGADHPGVFHLWTLADMDKLEAHIRNGAEKVLVIGGGFVGLELAENLNERKLEVTLIQRGRQLLPTLDYEMSSLLVTELRRQGIRVEMDTEVTSFQPEGKGFSAILSNGRELPADTAVLSIGVKPNSELAKTAGLELGTRGHIVTDQELRTSDPDIYAVGDVIEVTDPIFGGRTAIALAGPANRQGRMAADNITGRHSQYKGTIGTSVIKVGRLTAGMTGYSERRLASMDVPYHKIYLHPNSNASYYPGGAQLHMKVIFGHDGKLFGAQIVGAKGVDKRIDVISSAVWNGKKIQELAELELAYAPPYASAKDPVNLAGMIGENVIGGLTRLAHFDSLPDGCFLLDVREKAEFELGSLPGARNIPLGDLRKRLAELPRGRMIYIFCQSGLRGYVAERLLAQHSFDAVNLSGGYLTWKMFQPLQATPPDPVKKETGRPVLAVCKKQLDVRALACPGPGCPPETGNGQSEHGRKPGASCPAVFRRRSDELDQIQRQRAGQPGDENGLSLRHHPSQDSGRGVSCAACGSRGTDRRNRIVQQRSGQSDGGAHHCMRHGGFRHESRNLLHLLGIECPAEKSGAPGPEERALENVRLDASERRIPAQTFKDEYGRARNRNDETCHGAAERRDASRPAETGEGAGREIHCVRNGDERYGHFP